MTYPYRTRDYDPFRGAGKRLAAKIGCGIVLLIVVAILRAIFG